MFIICSFESNENSSYSMEVFGVVAILIMCSIIIGSTGGGLLIEANCSDQKKYINFAHECFKLRRLKQNSYSHNGSYSCLFMLYIIQHMK